MQAANYYTDAQLDWDTVGLNDLGDAIFDSWYPDWKDGDPIPTTAGMARPSACGGRPAVAAPHLILGTANGYICGLAGAQFEPVRLRAAIDALAAKLARYTESGGN